MFFWGIRFCASKLIMGRYLLISSIWSWTTSPNTTQRVPNTNKPQKGISTFLISNAEYKMRLINKGRKKKIENESNKVAIQIQKVASNNFFLIFFLFFKLRIRRNEKSMKRLEINVEVCSKTWGKTPINKQKNSAAKLLFWVRLFLVTMKITVKRDAIKTKR